MQEPISLQNDRTTEQRTIYDKIMVHVRGLESLGISSEKYESLLIPVILSHMPSEIALQVAHKTSENIWSIQDIINIIRREIEAREVSSKVSVKDSKKYEKSAKNLPIGTTKTFVTKFDKSKQSIECYFCSKDHYSSWSLIQTKGKLLSTTPEDAITAHVLVTMQRTVAKHEDAIIATVSITLRCVQLEQRIEYRSPIHRLQHLV